MGTKGIKRGIIQSRGLGDIIIALPIARYYVDQGDEVVWPVCEEFYSSVATAAPWVTWVSIPTDAAGAYFLAEPLAVFKRMGVDPAVQIYLYQYLNTVPELTNPEWFNILKFDQYKYQAAGVPFINKWSLSECITRDPAREASLRDRLNITGPYCVAHLTGSSAAVDVSLVRAIVDPAVQIINVDDYKTDCVFDWIGVLESADYIVCLDSSIANMVDQLMIRGPELFWIRRSPWDLTPVLGSAWKFVPTNLPIGEPTRVDPAAAARTKQGAQGATPSGSLTSHVPFATDRSKYPTSFMSALRK